MYDILEFGDHVILGNLVEFGMEHVFACHGIFVVPQYFTHLYDRFNSCIFSVILAKIYSLIPLPAIRGKPSRSR